VRRLVPVLTLLAVLAGAGSSRARAAGPPAPIPITSGWQLSFDNRSSWHPTTVPGVFDANTPADSFYGRVGWYRVGFTAPRAVPGFDRFLRFESVRRTGDVYLNGRYLGHHADPYVPFELPASGLRPGQRNLLEVRVDNRKGRQPREGWWNWGGIIRPVSLVAHGRVELFDHAVLTRDLGLGEAAMEFDGTIRNRSAGRLSPTVTITLRPPGGGTPTRVTRVVAGLRPGEARHLTFNFTVAQPHLWAPGDPALYAETADVSVGRTLEQRDRRDVGIRTVKVVDGRLELNGQHIQLRGAAIQEDVRGRGPALTDGDMDSIVAKLEALHANVTRAHYLLNERLLDRLDRAGILVWSQAPIYHRDVRLVTAAERHAALLTLRGTVLNARWHPSVLTHSVANELSPVADTVPGTRAYLDAARTLAGRLDPTIPTSIDMLSYPNYPRQRTYGQFPLLGINSYYGWYTGKAGHYVGNLDGFKPFLERMRQQYPSSAQVVTEFGAEATMNGPATEKQTYAFQSDYVKRNLAIVDSEPLVDGAIYWTLQEFAVKPRWDGGANMKSIETDSIHNKGLISYGGTIKPAWHVAAREFAQRATLFAPPPTPRGSPSPLGWALALLVPTAILALLALCGWALRDIWRFTRPPGAEIVALPQRRAA
jgi:beta-galactosidase/beta-glucuronidase